jgi:DNA repair photolyase
MNLYRGCAHDCAYCDGRAEGYYVAGEFGCDVGVKIHALDILRREIDPARRRKPLKRAYMLLGGGVGDCYQPLEREYRLSRGALELFLERGWPVHVLTKSTLVERDFDILREINQRARAIVSCSFSTVDDATARIFEPGASPPSERLALLRRAREAGLACGMFLMPVIPCVTDSPESIDRALDAARRAGVDFVIFGGLTLKEGRQYDHFMPILRRRFPEAAHTYSILYRGDRWGAADSDYKGSLNELVGRLAGRRGVSLRMPARLWRDILDQNDRVVTMLEHIDYYLRLWGRSSPYGYAAWSLSRVNEPFADNRFGLRHVKGVGPRVHRTVLEILDTGRSTLLERLAR